MPLEDKTAENLQQRNDALSQKRPLLPPNSLMDGHDLLGVPVVYVSILVSLWLLTDFPLTGVGPVGCLLVGRVHRGPSPRGQRTLSCRPRP